MKIIVLNAKGGVGKSTVAVQVLAPFLYLKNNKNDKINLVEFDDENEDSLTFNNSEILNTTRYKISDGNLDNILTDITIDNSNLIIDVGGNKTTTYLLESLENTNIINILDLIVIPLGDGQQDSINAVNVYNKIRILNKDIKILFALSRVDKNIDLEIQFLDFFGDTKGRIDNRQGLIENIKKADRNIIHITNNESIKISRAFGITSFELADTNLEELREKMKSFLKKDDKEKTKKASYRITLVNKAKTFKQECLNNCFDTLKNILK